MSGRARDEVAAVLLAWRFLTRVPIPRVPAWTPARMAAAPRWFPAVGAVIGAAGAFVLVAAASVLPMPVAVLLSTAATVALTGALHEDGLADTCDGMGAATRERALEIMRDSRLGTFGALGLGLTLATKVATLAAMPVGPAAAALLAGHAASRLSSLVVVATSTYARETGAGGFTAQGIGGGALAVAAATTVVAAAGLAWVALGLALAGAAGLAAGHLLARGLFERRIGGYTGDCLGATQQLSEVGLYLGVLAWL